MQSYTQLRYSIVHMMVRFLKDLLLATRTQGILNMKRKVTTHNHQPHDDSHGVAALFNVKVVVMDTRAVGYGPWKIQ